MLVKLGRGLSRRLQKLAEREGTTTGRLARNAVSDLLKAYDEAARVERDAPPDRTSSVAESGLEVVWNGEKGRNGASLIGAYPREGHR